MGFDADGRSYPYWDATAGGMVVGHPEPDVLLVVVPMLVNDRLNVCRREEYGHSYTAGFCYDKGGRAVVNGLLWATLWESQKLPLNFKKEAYNFMANYDFQRYGVNA